MRHGYIVLDAYFYPYTGETAHDIASVTKSIISSLVGLAVEKGYIDDIEASVLDFFPEYAAAHLPSDKKSITIKNLLSMSSGLNCGYKLGEPELFAMIKSEDWVQFALDLPMSTAPGTEFAYCRSGMHLLSAIITQTTGMSALAFAHKYLFEPLGIKEVFWPLDTHGINHGWGDLQMYPHDMAKIGYLYLNRGKWEDCQVLSQDWIKASTQKQIDLPGGDGDYGYGWWILSGNFSGLYEARGRGGQRISVWPEKDLVFVITAGGINLGELAPLLIPALKSDRALPENPDAYRRLLDRIADASGQTELKPASPLTKTAHEVSGKKYQLEGNKLGVEVLSLNFKAPKEALFTVSLVDGKFIMPVGLDGVYRFSTDGPSNMPVALKGFWQADNRFVLHYNEVARINNFTIFMTFSDEEVVVEIYDPTGYFNQTVAGKIQH